MSFEMKENIFTYVLTNGALTIDSGFGVRAICIKLVSGSGTFEGTMKLGAQDSDPISLVVNDPITISCDPSNYIDGLTITATVGVVNIIARK